MNEPISNEEIAREAAEWKVFDVGGIGVRDIQTPLGRIIDVPADKAALVAEFANAALTKACAERESQLEKMKRVAEHGPRTLDAKWLDPECWDGCQSLIYKHKAESLSSQLAVMKAFLLECEKLEDTVWARLRAKELLSNLPAAAEEQKGVYALEEMYGRITGGSKSRGSIS